MISPVLGRVTVALSGPQARAWCQGHGFQGTCEGDYKPGKGESGLTAKNGDLLSLVLDIVHVLPPKAQNGDLAL